jgi:glycosyltransferase involved in cell wall biosynthesis
VKIKVANIIEEGKVGGPQVRMINVAKGIEREINTIIIMPTENSENFRERCRGAGVAYIALAISRITKEPLAAFKYLLFSISEVFKITHLLKHGNFDLIHVSGGSWQYKGLIAGRLAGIKVIWHLNDTSMPWFFRKIFYLLNPLADGFIFASHRSLKYYDSIISDKKNSAIIPAPVDTNKFNPNKICLSNDTLSGKFVIGTVANVNPVKGLEIFIQAAAYLNIDIKNAYFVVIGEVFNRQKKYYKSLLNLCNELSVDNIKFISGVSDVRPLLSRFDVYVCSSNFESSPISVWEAMSMGKPIISTDVGDVPLYVENNKNGFIVDVGDAFSLAEKLKLLSKNRKLCQKFGCLSRDISIKKLDISYCLMRHISIYNNIVKKK